MTEQKSKYERKAIYSGRRLNLKGKTIQEFLLLPERKAMYFSGVKGVYLGYTYECSDSSIAARPNKTDDERIDDPIWDAEDALVDAKNRERRAALKWKNSSRPALKRAIESLRPLLVGKGSFDRRALVQYLADEAVRKK